MSATVTVAPQVPLFELPSVIVKTTALLPKLEQVKAFGETLLVEMLQLSVLLLSTIPVVTDAFPPPSNWTVTSWQIAVGLVVSATVTVAPQVPLFELPSVMVKTTALLPKLEQAKAFGETLLVEMLQLSVLLLSTIPVVTDAFPPPSN